MISFVLGTIGSLSIAVGLTHLILNLNMNMSFIEILLYFVVGSFIVIPHMKFAENLDEMTKFLFNIFGLIALPCLEILTAILHESKNSRPEELGMLIGLSVGLLSLTLANILDSEFIATYGLLAIYLGFNSILEHLYLGFRHFEFMSKMNVLFSLFLLLMLFLFNKNISPYDKAISIIASTTLFIHVLHLGSYDLRKGIPGSSYFLWNLLYLAILFGLYLFSRYQSTSLLRFIVMIFGIAWLISKYIDIPWKNWGLAMIFFGVLIYSFAFCIPQSW